MPISRFSLVRKIFTTWWSLAYGLWGLLASIDFGITKFGSAAFQSRWNSYWIIPKWGWQTWVIGFLAITICIVFERAYQDHVRLVSKLGIAMIPHLLETPVEQGGERRVYIQIEPKCLTESPVYECRGHLLAVFKRHSHGQAWAPTEFGRFPLEWSYQGAGAITLYPSGGQYLNICFRPYKVSVLVPSISPLPSRWREIFDSTGIFRFDIEITARDCAPVQKSVTVTLDNCEWNKPIVAII